MRSSARNSSASVMMSSLFVRLATRLQICWEPLFDGLEPDTTEENIQSRIRGLTLMALSNKFGPMLVTTGNKSEMAVGYATIYGDMSGGYNPIKDIYKTEVFALCNWRNEHNPDDMLGGEQPIPERIITKPPSAELREDQKDSDSLPRLSGLGRYPDGVDRAGTPRRSHCRARFTRKKMSCGFSAYSISRSINAGRRRPASKLGQRISVAIAAIRSPIATVIGSGTSRPLPVAIHEPPS